MHGLVDIILAVLQFQPSTMRLLLVGQQRQHASADQIVVLLLMLIKAILSKKSGRTIQQLGWRRYESNSFSVEASEPQFQVFKPTVRVMVAKQTYDTVVVCVPPIWVRAVVDGRCKLFRYPLTCTESSKSCQSSTAPPGYKDLWTRSDPSWTIASASPTAGPL